METWWGMASNRPGASSLSAPGRCLMPGNSFVGESSREISAMPPEKENPFKGDLREKETRTGKPLLNYGLQLSSLLAARITDKTRVPRSSRYSVHFLLSCAP